MVISTLFATGIARRQTLDMRTRQQFVLSFRKQQMLCQAMVTWHQHHCLRELLVQNTFQQRMPKHSRRQYQQQPQHHEPNYHIQRLEYPTTQMFIRFVFLRTYVSRGSR